MSAPTWIISWTYLLETVLQVNISYVLRATYWTVFTHVHTRSHTYTHVHIHTYIHNNFLHSSKRSSSKKMNRGRNTGGQMLSNVRTLSIRVGRKLLVDLYFRALGVSSVSNCIREVGIYLTDIILNTLPVKTLHCWSGFHCRYWIYDRHQNMLSETTSSLQNCKFYQHAQHLKRVLKFRNKMHNLPQFTIHEALFALKQGWALSTRITENDK